MGGLSWEGPIGSCSIKVILVFSKSFNFSDEFSSLCVCVCVCTPLLTCHEDSCVPSNKERLAKFSYFIFSIIMFSLNLVETSP